MAQERLERLGYWDGGDEALLWQRTLGLVRKHRSLITCGRRAGTLRYAQTLDGPAIDTHRAARVIAMAEKG